MDTRAAIELFHLIFLHHLGTRIDKGLYSVKGGCNLRFFFKSIRYSEDIDLDVHTIGVGTLSNGVRKILKSRPFIDTLSARRITIQSISEPKQTETTQRWKIALAIENSAASLPTKIEFSRREDTFTALFEPIDPELLSRYDLYPILCTHYTRDIAIRQKIEALAGRNQTQARDVFDLAMLVSGNTSTVLSGVSTQARTLALSRAMALTFQDYLSQVVAFLEPQYQDHYGREATWDQMLIALKKTAYFTN